MTNVFPVFWEERREAIQGWLLSLIVHAVLGTAALFFMTNMLVIQKPEPFRLSMSVLKPPPEPVKRPQTVRNTPVEQQRVEQKPVTQPVVKPQRTKQAPTPVEQQVVQKKKTVETPVSKQQPVKSRPVREVSPVNPVTHTVTTRKPVEQQTVMVKNVDMPVPQYQAISSPPVQRKASKTPITQHVVAQLKPKVFRHELSNSPQPSLVDDRQVTRQAPVQQVDAVSRPKTQPTQNVAEKLPEKLRHIPAIVTGSISRSMPSIQKVATPMVTSPKVSTSVVTKTPATQSTPSRVIQRNVLTKAKPSVVRRHVKQDPTAITDYQWVANTLLEKVQKLKRYPARAKRRRWEGTVTLSVSIRANGEIQEVRVLESSGHVTLDQEAVNTVKMASPLTLKYPLDGRSHVLVNLPLTYKLI